MYRPCEGFYVKKSVIAMLIFYIASYLFVYVIWTGNARMTKLRPVVSLIYKDLFEAEKTEGLSEDNLGAYRTTYQNLWQRVEGDAHSLYQLEVVFVADERTGTGEAADFS